MPKGDNKCVINLTTELKLFMDNKKGDLERSFHCVLAYLEKYQADFVSKYGQECYDEHIKRYSRTAIELRNEAAKRNKEFIERKKLELELREKELAIKTKNAENFEIQTQGANDVFINSKAAEEIKAHMHDPDFQQRLKRIKAEFPNDDIDGYLAIKQT